MVSAQIKKPLNYAKVDTRLLQFGFSFGANTMDLGIKRSLSAQTGTVLIPDISNIQPGFQVQILSNLRLRDNLSLCFLPGISFGSRVINFYEPGDSSLAGSVTIESSYLDFPLHLKYRAKRLNNYRPYIIGGANYRYDMATSKQNEIRLKPGDVYLEMGVGVDWYLPFFKLATEIKFGVGLFDLIVRDPKSNQDYIAAIDRMNSYVLGFSFHFQ